MHHFPALLSLEVFAKAGRYCFGSPAKKCSASEKNGNKEQVSIRRESQLCPEAATSSLSCCLSPCGRVPSCGTRSPVCEPPGLAGAWGRRVPRLWVHMVSRRLLLLSGRLGVLRREPPENNLAQEIRKSPKRNKMTRGPQQQCDCHVFVQLRADFVCGHPTTGIGCCLQLMSLERFCARTSTRQKNGLQISTLN